MMFQKKVDRAMDWLKNKNRNEKTDKDLEREDLELEKNDVLAIIISALIVFIPIFIILGIIIWLVR